LSRSRHIPFESFCEHHLAAIRSIVHVGYLPRDQVVGISKISQKGGSRTTELLGCIRLHRKKGGCEAALRG
jgi:hypothetical protein